MLIKFFGKNSLEIFKLLPFTLSSTKTEKLISLIKALNGPLWAPETKDYVFTSIFFALLLVILGGAWAKQNKYSSFIKYIQPTSQPNNLKHGHNPIVFHIQSTV